MEYSQILSIRGNEKDEITYYIYSENVEKQLAFDFIKDGTTIIALDDTFNVLYMIVNFKVADNGRWLAIKDLCNRYKLENPTWKLMVQTIKGENNEKIN